MDYRLLGARVQRARRINGLTQERLAEMAGISLSFMGHIERGTRKAASKRWWRSRGRSACPRTRCCWARP